MGCFPEFPKDQAKTYPDNPRHDYDGDGFFDDDCNDRDPNIHPAAAELCDPLQVDENCDGVVNGVDAVDVITWYFDSDGYCDR